MAAAAMISWASQAVSAAAERPERAGCLSTGEATEAVASRRAVAAADAIGLARRTVPNADVLRAALCSEPDALVYRITVLRTDGKLVRVTVDAPSGKVKSVH